MCLNVPGGKLPASLRPLIYRKAHKLFSRLLEKLEVSEALQVTNNRPNSKERTDFLAHIAGSVQRTAEIGVFATPTRDLPWTYRFLLHSPCLAPPYFLVQKGRGHASGSHASWAPAKKSLFLLKSYTGGAICSSLVMSATSWNSVFVTDRQGLRTVMG